ncbi:unnamed protein product [Lampetra planeri]
MAVALVQGASRGLGLAFCRHLLARPGFGSQGEKSPVVTVIATCRDPDGARELQALQQPSSSSHSRLQMLRMDVTQEDEIRRAAEMVTQQHGRVDLLINVAAMLHPGGRGETSLRDVTAEGLTATLAVNTLGPLLMAKHFAGLLQKGGGHFGRQMGKGHSAVLVNISARVGSIGDNALGGWYSYRLSKAALNMATRNLGVELSRGKGRVVCISVHPGTVDTDLSRAYHRNVPLNKLFTPEKSVQHIMNVVNKLAFEQTGKFYAWDGTEIPW